MYQSSQPGGWLPAALTAGRSTSSQTLNSPSPLSGLVTALCSTHRGSRRRSAAFSEEAIAPMSIGRTHARTHVLLLIQDLHIRVIHAATGQLLRQLTLDPTRDYQPTGAPKGPTWDPHKTNNPEPK